MTDGEPSLRFVHDAMGTEFCIVVDAADPEYARQAADSAFEELAGLERHLSRFASGSDVARINALGDGGAVRVSPATMDCLLLARQVTGETGGAFDVTVRSGRPAMDLVRLDGPGLTVQVGSGGAALDLGGIGKGLAADVMAGVLREWDIGPALIDAGQSTVLATGDRARRVDLRHPGDADTGLGAVVLCESALSGSGTSEQGDHIIDPRTGQPAALRPAAWAVAPTAALADALSTAFMVMSRAEVESYCSLRPGVSAILCGGDGQGFAVTCFPDEKVLVSADGPVDSHPRV